MVGKIEKLVNVSRVAQAVTTMAKKLHHFEGHGVGESTRYLLHYGGHKFEDVRYKYTEQPAKHVQDIHPFGQLPIYQEGDKTLNQSLAIARYIGAKNKLVPNDLFDQAKLDATVYNINDFWNKVTVFIKEEDPKKKEALKKEIENETVDFFFSRFEEDLKNNKGFFIGKLSWADFVLVGIVEATNLFLSAELEKKYPHVVSLLKKIRTLPGVKDYIASRKPMVI